MAYGGRGFLRYPLRRLNLHRGRWYQVDTHQREVNPFLDDTPEVRTGRLDSLAIWMHFDGNDLTVYKPTGRVGRLDRLHRTVTYATAPHQKQVLLANGIPDPQTLVGLNLTQGTGHRTLVPGSPFATLFRATQEVVVGDCHWYQRQLTLGPLFKSKNRVVACFYTSFNRLKKSAITYHYSKVRPGSKLMISDFSKEPTEKGSHLYLAQNYILPGSLNRHFREQTRWMQPKRAGQVVRSFWLGVGMDGLALQL